MIALKIPSFTYTFLNNHLRALQDPTRPIFGNVHNINVSSREYHVTC